MSQKQTIRDERSVAFNSSATTNQERGSLTGYVSKALTELLEANGGIRTFSGKRSQKLRAALDNSSSDTFGRRGDVVYYWQMLVDKGAYEGRVLKVLGVRSHESRMADHYNSVNNAIQPTPQPLSSSSESSSKASSSSNSTLDAPTKTFKKLAVSKNLFGSPPTKQIILNKNTILPVTPLTPAISISLKDKKMSAALPKNASKFNSMHDDFSLFHAI